MPKTAIAVHTKKPATAEHKTAVERPHKDLTQTQEEVADLASDILLNGGAREDVDLLLTALLRHRVRRMSPGRHFAATDPAKADRDANWSANYLAEKFYRSLAQHWPERKDEPTNMQESPAPKTVAEMMRTNIRVSAREQFEEFITDSEGLEAVWLINEVLRFHNCGADIVEEFCDVMETAGMYVRVPWKHKARIEEFVNFLQKEAVA